MESERMKFIMASANDRDYTDELTKAGIKVETETLVFEYPITNGIKARTHFTRIIADLDSLDDLLKVKKAVGYDLVIGRDWKFDKFPKITVYDGYLE